jgi:hypothetical protein
MYNDRFYQGQMAESYNSAKIYASYLSNFLVPKTVVDVGCGRGTWLKAFHEIGAKKLVGFDGAWNTQSAMVEKSISFNACDLNKPISVNNSERFDLAISLEVAEHIEPSSALTFVTSLTNLSDIVLFSAAFTGQGGKSHINERKHTDWANQFISLNYEPFDIFRQVFWADDRIPFWYRQNVFLYVHKDSDAYDTIKSKNIASLSNIAFMDCIHPELYLVLLQRLSSPLCRLDEALKRIYHARSNFAKVMFKQARVD